MQASTQPNPPLPPQATLAPAAPVSITTIGADGRTQQLAIPSTRAEMRALLAQRRELTQQLNSVAERRSSLASEIGRTSLLDAATRAGLEGRMRLLDQRILQIETDLGAVGRQISSAPAQLIASTESPRGPDSEFAPGFATGGVVVAMAFATVVMWRRFKKRRGGPPPTTPTIASDQRLDRLEHAIEAIAIEIERVSEGQRFVTKLLAEKAPIAATNRIAQASSVEQDA
jgi:hypothetical protein